MQKPEVHSIQMFLLPLALLVSILLFSHSETAKHLDYDLNDKLTRYLAQSLSPDPDIVVINIDDYSLTQMMPVAGRWVWPRAIHAELIEGLTGHAPQAIVFDILFSEPDIYRPDSDTYFNEVLSATDNVYLAMMELTASEGDQGVLISELPNELGFIKTDTADQNARAHILVPAAIDKEYWRLGTINFVADSDGVGRQYDIWRNIQGWKIPSLPLKSLERIKLPPMHQSKIILQWRGGIQSFNTFSYADVYQAIQNENESYLTQFHNKIIIIGSTAAGLFDLRATPISNQYPAVYMLATAIDNLKNQRYLAEVAPIFSIIISISALLILALLFHFIQKFNLKLFVAAIFSLTYVAALILVSYLLLSNKLIFYVATPITVAIACYITLSLQYGLKEYLARKHAVAMFGRFLDPKVVTTLVEQGQLDLTNTSQNVYITVLFTDIRNFTSISEQKSAQEIVNLLNQYFDQQVKTIFSHNGTLDKFIGDCIMAFWGAPISNNRQEVDAINTALAMEKHLISMQKNLGNSDFDVGIGIHSGEAVVGMIGTNQRVDYTAIGDTVNLASRIEGVTKNKARILVSEQTMLACKDEFEFIYHGEFTVKGRAQAVKLFQPKRKES